MIWLVGYFSVLSLMLILARYLDHRFGGLTWELSVTTILMVFWPLSLPILMLLSVRWGLNYLLFRLGLRDEV